MTRAATSDYWYKNAIFYEVDVETFRDADGDGVGDFQGLVSRLDYLERLGVDCLWLPPFYPSPGRDNGYDVADYYDVDSRYGTLGDFVTLVHEAHSRGLHVLIDMVVNHTSDEHPWFRAARRGEEPYRDYYVWSADPPEPDAAPIFPDSEDSVWTYDDEAEAYYYHRFYDFEPGLNLSNPDVRAEIRKIMGFWLAVGVDGFRFDAAPIMISKKGLESTAMERPHDVFKEFRRFVERRSENVVLLGEAGGGPTEVGAFYGDGDELDMLFNFLLADYVFHSLATGDSGTLAQGLETLPELPETGQWATFLRNHDELNLEWLTESQRQDVFDAFAPSEEGRVFGRGIRRRLAPMLDGDRQRILQAFSLLLTLPGAPLIYYGDEIGMGDDLSLDGRSAVRTPMQWTDGHNAGFSPAPSEELPLPVIDDGPYGYETVNVEAQRQDENSLLTELERLIWTRKEHPEFGWGEYEILDTGSHAVFAHRCAGESASIALHNFGDEPHAVTLELETDATRLIDVLKARRHAVEDGRVGFELDAYDYRWLSEVE
ncbi:alpha-amylase family protein [Halobacteriaceae archaeon GCM10025711]